jgi:hypothetical protein
VVSYDENTFEPISIIFDFKYYTINKENDEYISINKCIFYKNKNNKSGLRYLYDYFYTKQEERKEKLNKIQNDNKE